MSDVSGPTHGFCKRCLIAYEADSVFHSDEHDCIAHLKLALRKSRERERTTGFAVATRMLGILEELTHRPETGGVDYKVFTSAGPNGKGVVGGSIEEQTIPAEKVSGIFAALLAMYERMGDWSPYEAEKERAYRMEVAATRCLAALTVVQDLVEKAVRKADSDPGLLDAQETIRATLASLPQQDLAVLQSFAGRADSLPG